MVDTTIWVDYFRGLRTPHTEWLEAEMTTQPIGVLDLVLCEILQGISKKSEFDRVKSNLLRFELLTSGGEELAVLSAQNYQALRTHGFTVHKTIDCLIATYCVTHGHSLLHNDRDFDPFESMLGLRVIHPAKLSVQ